MVCGGKGLGIPTKIYPSVPNLEPMTQIPQKNIQAVDLQPKL